MENASGCPAIDYLIESSRTHDNGKTVLESNHLQWIPYSEFTDIELTEPSTDKQPTHYAMYKRVKSWNRGVPVEMLRIGTRNECTQEFITEFAKTHSLPTYKYSNPSNINQFRRYSTWLKRRNKLIIGFTRDNNNFYLVADRRFHHLHYVQSTRWTTRNLSLDLYWISYPTYMYTFDNLV